MELQVLYDDQTVKCALIFTGFDQYSTKMKLLWCTLHRWSTFESGGVWYSLEALQLFKCLSGCCHYCRAAVAKRSFMRVYILTILACESWWLHVWSFSVLLIEVVASGQLAESFFLSDITDLWAVFCLCKPLSMRFTVSRILQISVEKILHDWLLTSFAQITRGR